ncbi:ATP-binding protein [Microbacterium sp. 13-71-7]|uniref:ATP-binding protein n=1 Tax=Microbacterium sp. 13-71-7 TaxID=1970399 RepID=UPI0025EF9186|nr:ATP-binding protein [Microbacterium sp. 13-71-7]
MSAAHERLMRISPITGTVEGHISSTEDITMSMDEDATAFLMASISTSLYADPHRAVLRELVSNALDSHVRAGVSSPVRVTLPTTLSPTLIVHDDGVGLDLHDIRSMFSKFGGSDKRNTDGERGGFGLGSKSPLALTAQYTFVARKDGLEHLVLVARGEDFIPVMKVLKTTVTEAHDGVEVHVPVSNATERMSELVFDEHLFLTVDPQSLHVNGASVPVTVHDSTQFRRIDGDDGVALGWWARSPHFSVVPNRRPYQALSPRADVLGVHYPLSETLSPKALKGMPGHRIILSVPNGAVGFATSRDALLPTPRTIKAVKAVADAYSRTLSTTLWRLVRSAQTPAEALALYAEVKDVPGMPMSWRGVKFEDSVALHGRVSLFGGARRARGHVLPVGIGEPLQYVCVPLAEVNRVQAALSTLRATGEAVPRTYIATAPLIAQHMWAQAALTNVDAEELLSQARALRKSRTAKRNSSLAASPERVGAFIITDDSFAKQYVEASEVTGPVAYVTSTSHLDELFNHRGQAGYTHSLGSHPALRMLAERGFTLVTLTAKHDPTTVFEGQKVTSARNIVAEYINDVLSEAEQHRMTLAVQRDRRWMHLSACAGIVGVDVSTITDERVRDGIEAMNAHVPAHVLALLRWSGSDLCAPITEFSNGLTAPEYLELPFIDAMSFRNALLGFSPEHFVAYINAVTGGDLPA